MAAIKSMSEIADKFITVTPQRATQYAEGVKSPKKDWEGGALAAEPAFEAGIQKAVQLKAFGKGIKKAGTAKYQKGVAEKGAARWGPGVALAKDAFTAGFSPFHSIIERIQLPQRFARRDPRNLLRVSAITKELGDAKERGV